MFNHILTFRRDFQIGVKSGAVEGYFLRNKPGLCPTKVNPPSEQTTYGKNVQNKGERYRICEGSISHLHLGGSVDTPVRTLGLWHALSPTALCNMSFSSHILCH